MSTIKDNTKTHYKVVYVNQLKPFTCPDVSSCHKVLMVMDDPGPEDGDFLMHNHFKGIDLSDDMKADLDKLLAQFSECLSDKLIWQPIVFKLPQSYPFGRPIMQFLLMLKLSLNKSWITC